MRLGRVVFYSLFCLTLVLGLGIFAGPVRAQETFRLSPEARFQLGMDSGYIWHWGEMLIPAGGRPDSGTKIDVASELGVNQGEATGITFNGIIQNSHLVNFDYLLYSPSGVKRLPRTLRFHNRTYAADTTVETRLDFNWLRFDYGYKLWDMSSWWVAPRVGMHYVRYSATLNGKPEEEEGTTSNNRSLDTIFPVIGLEARYLLPLGAELIAEVEGMHLITTGFLAMLKLEARWELHPDVTLSIAGFNRFVQCQEDNQPLNNEWSFGLFGGTAGVSFAF
ncbi:MAG: hypothetical protein HY912_20375 [Desulfomonile tiedjei]|uniref:Uncharacterized protein n=1 Tax=Desulfomonile tiedjei TaxID=2358 RepID=A0A9D6V4D2_9BACT|nr:hypothetical protein [Desulfomonile tiedjei]